MNSQPQQVDVIGFSSFLEGTDWAGAKAISMGADMGLRRYYLLEKDDKSALLMDMSRAGYEAGLKSYLDIAEFLSERGVRTPEIYKHDPESGLSIIEHLGDTSFGDAVKNGDDKAALYRLATDVLVKIRQGATENTLKLGTYNESLIRDRLKQFVDFYMKVALGIEPTAQIHAEFQEVWSVIEQSLPSCPATFCHADYHLENLIWRPDTPEQYGLIDFQDAFWGPPPYDLLNLLEDARQTVPAEIKAEMKERYCADMSAAEKDAFEKWYVVLSAHFHCRVIGLFVKFPLEGGDKAFLDHIPRLQGYILKGLEDPVLAPLKAFIERYGISFDVTPDVSCAG